MRTTRIIFAFVAFSVLTSAYATNMGFIKDSPGSKFNDQDMAMFWDTIKKALNESPDGTTTEWKNTKTGSSGTVTPLDTIQQKSGKCRNLHFNNSYKSLRGEDTVILCQQANGDWKVPKK
jgi:surface antigen